MKKIIILLFAITSTAHIFAQVTHEFSINGGGGLSTLNYKLSSGQKTLGFGGDFGLGYTCIFGKYVGIQVGAGLGLYNSKANLNDSEVITPNLADSDGDVFDMYTKLANYEEIYKTMFINIPIMAQVQVKKFYAMGGIKIGIPLSSKYNVSDASLTNKGYYPEYDNWAIKPAFAGFGTFHSQSSEGNLKMGVSATLAIEAGMKWEVGKIMAIYVGAYFDYGVNNILKENKPFINYINTLPAEFSSNSALPYVTEKVNLMAAGLKLRFALKK